MEAAKDLLLRAVELDAADKHSEALICYEEGIQNILRAMGGENINFTTLCVTRRYATITCNAPIG